MESRFNYPIFQINDSQTSREEEKSRFDENIKTFEDNNKLCESIFIQNTEKNEYNGTFEKIDEPQFYGSNQSNFDMNEMPNYNNCGMNGFDPPNFTYNENENQLSCILNNPPNSSLMTDNNIEPKNENQNKSEINFIITNPKKIFFASNKKDTERININDKDLSPAKNIMGNNKKEDQILNKLEEDDNENTNFISNISKGLNINPDNKDIIDNVCFKVIVNVFNYMKNLIKAIFNIELSSSFNKNLNEKKKHNCINLFDIKMIDLLLDLEENKLVADTIKLYIHNQNNFINELLSKTIKDIINIYISDDNESKKIRDYYLLTNFNISFQDDLFGSCKEQKDEIKKSIISILNNNQKFENNSTKMFITKKKKKKVSINNWGDERILIIRKCYNSAQEIINDLYKDYENKNKDFQELDNTYIDKKIQNNNFENYREFCNLKLKEVFSNNSSKNEQAFNFIINKEKDLEEKSILYLLLEETNFGTILEAFLNNQSVITILGNELNLTNFQTFNCYCKNYSDEIKGVLKEDMEGILGKKENKGSHKKNELLKKKEKKDKE